MVFGCVVMFFRGVSCNPKRTPPERKKKKGKGSSCSGAAPKKQNQTKTEQNKTAPNTNWGRVMLLCDHHPKPSKTLSPKTKVTNQKTPKQKVGGVKRSTKFSRKWCRNKKSRKKKRKTQKPPRRKDFSAKTTNRTQNLARPRVEIFSNVA